MESQNSNWKKLSGKQITDAGMALVLILLIIRYFVPNDLFLILAMIGLVTDMIYPKLFHPFAWIWYALAGAIGYVMSNLLLSLVFFVLIVPVGLIRRLLAGDKLYISNFKKEKRSVFYVRDHTFVHSDIQKPY